MHRLLPGFKKVRILVAGDLILDRYWSGSTHRISPEAPVPVVRIEDLKERAGGAGNVAANIASLGGHVILLGICGDDEHANSLERILTESGVKCLFSRQSDYNTVSKIRILSRHQQLVRLDFEDQDPSPSVTELAQVFTAAMAAVNVVVFSDYGKGSLVEIRELIGDAREAGIPVVVDPKGADLARYAGATVLTPNFGEFVAVVGECPDETTIEDKARALCERYYWDAMLITRGADGLSLVRRNEPAVHLPAHARDVYDVTGAGDTVCAILGLALGAGCPLALATAIANTAAGIVVGKSGTATVSTAELTTALDEHHHGDRSGILTVEQLLNAVRDARLRGERIVMTNGCFDLLHAGHVGYLNEARRLGDRLLVAVNDDESVRALKGPDRPINTLKQRMEVLDGLAAVDWVMQFSGATPEDLICLVLPDLLVKGGDYQPDEIAGADCVREAGGEVLVLDYREGSSTSQVIEAITGGAKREDQP